MAEHSSGPGSGERFDPGQGTASDETVSGLWRDIRVVAAFLTRLPFGGPPDIAALAQASRAFPVVGAGIGAVGAIALGLALSLGLPSLAAALAAIAVICALTGALHEDGLADVADAFAGGSDAVRRLAIMRDSRIGTFAALALIFSIGLRVAAVGGISDAGAAAGALVAAAAGSRGILPAVMRAFPLARRDGMAAAMGRPPREAGNIAALLGALFVLLFLGPLGGLLAIAVGTLAAICVASLARRKVGGLTGDVLGAVQQVSEITVLLVAAAVL
ncbi:MAG: adenosylcobinamide-GDP ribazoletransferase [Alphaproteobacteria bacterium]|nr:adenosylcobinamide-GDP ribazoletransferase [Alphaproteobacteria bacterium]